MLRVRGVGVPAKVRMRDCSEVLCDTCEEGGGIIGPTPCFILYTGCENESTSARAVLPPP